MKRIRLVLAVAAMMAAMVVFAAPAMADNDRHDNRADRIEERLENHGFDVDVDEEDVFFVNPFLFGIDGFVALDDVDDVDIDFDDGEFEVD